MKHLCTVVLLFTIWAGAPTPSTSVGSRNSSAEVHLIIERALRRAKRAEEQAIAARYRHTLIQRARTFNEDGETIADEKRLYRVEPVRGVPYAKLVAKNGNPIEGDDLRTERTRWHAFLKELNSDPTEKDPVKEQKEDNDLVFNEDMVARYTADLQGIRKLRGRPSYVLSFKPLSGRLPVRRRLDYALNKSRGEIWIDRATYEIARVSFQLMERVRIWWGILGSISDATGHYERRPITEDVWLATELDLYFHRRILFSTTRRGQTSLWDQFELVGE